jgi:LacI family gluconate utilization system Gnt-I transcriptional repressor
LVSDTNASPRKARRKNTGVTMAEVAAAANVSMQTVSRFLRFPDTVTAETSAAIQAAIDKTHYVHNLAASHLASARSNTVAAIIPTLSASVFAETIQHLSDVLDQHGYQIFLGNTDYQPDREEAVIRSLLGRRPDGLFIVGTHHSQASVGLLRRAGIPVVEGWDMTNRPIDRLVGFSNTAAIAAMVRYLVDSGRRRIVFAGSMRRGDSRASERRDGFVATIRELFPAEEPRLVLGRDMPLGMTGGIELLERSIERYPDADAIMFSSDVLASGALLESIRRGIDVPGRLAITGFGDFELARHLNPSLTTVAVPAAEIGRQAGRLLLEGMRGNATADKRIDVGFELVIRQSA